MRSIFYCFDPVGGFKVSRLYLTAAEAELRTDITTVEPPEETEEDRALFDPETNSWSLVPR